jgi:hypothetical protein
MSLHLLEQNRKIRQEADKLQHENKLLEILSQFGRPHISGSYELDLMTWRDLDIYLQSEGIDEKCSLKWVEL